MPRSIKKGPYIDEKLRKKVLAMKETGEYRPIKTWARSSMVLPEFIGFTFSIHKGNGFVNVRIVEGMVGHKLGEFAPTRTFRSHSSKKIK